MLSTEDGNHISFTVPQINKDAVNELIKLGHKVAIVTGRP
jgi:hydroxymethylpyrimidine pyrophosphatase-like HAD family hydrolase